MSGIIPEETIGEILRRADIVELVGEHVPLRKVGAGYQGLCPFHPDSKPSFYVNGERQFFHCFGCGVGGNVFHFMMRLHHMSFPEAVKAVAARCGVSLPQHDLSPEEKRRKRHSLLLLEAHELATTFFRQTLLSPEGEHARAYLLDRGISVKTQEAFGLGLAPQGWQSLVDYLRRKGFPLSTAEEAGIIIRGRDGGYYDRFRNRIVFPIQDEGGRVIGFGGRTLTDESPKYLNSPDSPVFSKGKNLYGLYMARGAIRDLDCAVVVEGYTDLLSLYEGGITNVVATLGTAMTSEQMRRLKRFTNSVIYLFDGDEAGERATIRVLDLCLDLGVWGKVLRLPPSHDPDSYVRRFGAEALKEELKGAIPLMDYWIQGVFSKTDPNNPEEKTRCLQQVIPKLRKLSSPVAFDHYVAMTAERLRVREGRLRELLREEARGVGLQIAEERPLEDQHRTERLLLKAILSRPALTSVLGEEVLNEISNADLRSLANLLAAWSAERGGQDLRDFAAKIQEPLVAQTLTELLAGLDEVGEDPERLCQECLRDLRRRHVEARIHELREAMVKAETQRDEKISRALAVQLHELILEKKRLRSPVWKDRFVL